MLFIKFLLIFLKLDFIPTGGSHMIKCSQLLSQETNQFYKAKAQNSMLNQNVSPKTRFRAGCTNKH